MNRSSRERHGRLLDQGFHRLIIFGHSEPVVAANEFHVRSTAFSGGEGDDVFNVHRSRRIGFTLCDFDEHRIASVLPPSDLRWLSFVGQARSENQPEGVVVNFGSKAGTGAGSRAQDMIELEIFG